jgi:uncharacterized protein YgbK (DUF1537 family)
MKTDKEKRGKGEKGCFPSAPFPPFPSAPPLSLLADAIRQNTDAVNALAAWLKSHVAAATKQDLAAMERRLLMTSNELSIALDKLTTQVGKVAKEQSDRFDVLTAKIKELTDIINAGGEVTPEVTAALEATQAALNSLDAAIPDAP